MTQVHCGIHLSALLLRAAYLRFPIGLCSMHAPALTWIPLYIGALLFAMQEGISETTAIVNKQQFVILKSGLCTHSDHLISVMDSMGVERRLKRRESPELAVDCTNIIMIDSEIFFFGKCIGPTSVRAVGRVGLDYCRYYHGTGGYSKEGK